MKLEHHLILNRFFHSLFQANNLDRLKTVLKDVPEGPAADGQSHFFRAIDNLELIADTDLHHSLAGYDRRIMAYERQLAQARGRLSFKYFQYLCLLYSEIFLDRLTRDSNLLLNQVNAFLKKLKTRESAFKTFPPFEPDDLHRLAFFMATGSGKTLILHVHLWQIKHYSDTARDKQALVRRLDGGAGFDNILLITPNEGLSRQHLTEFQLSGIEASLLSQDRNRSNGVKIVEIHKLSDTASKDGVGIVMDSLGSQNLVFVDEGHKGTGSEAQTWKNRQKKLSADGFLVEYSATFAQSVAAAGKTDRPKLLDEYGKCILFDYAYRHFYDDGYGKDFNVLNLSRAREDQAFELLLGGLLVFYHQLNWYHNHPEACRQYLLERPLWIFLGSSVNAVYMKDREKRSDVATIVAFLKKLLEDPAWAHGCIQAVVDGKSGFFIDKTRRDIFVAHIPDFKNRSGSDLYEGMRRDIFQGQGGLELWDITHADGEIGLRVSSPTGTAMPYFGVINIGDVGAFKKHVQSDIGMDVGEDRLAGSVFSDVDLPESRVSMLIGSRKFVEGWSSWRVSAMGLLNMGKGEGPQVIQLFGRGIRLKGRNWSLKRSGSQHGQHHPDGLNHLERLFIFGWNANYIQAFRNMLEQEDMNREITIPVQIQCGLWKQLPVPKPETGYDVTCETWTLDPMACSPGYVDLSPRVTLVSGNKRAVGAGGRAIPINFSQMAVILDQDALYADIAAYKVFRGYHQVFIPKNSLIPVLEKSRLDVAVSDRANPAVLQEGAGMILKMVLDRFVAMKEREEEGKHLIPTTLAAAHESVIPFYTARAHESLIPRIEKLIKSRSLFRDDETGEILPRLHVDRHLYSPILLNPGDVDMEGVSFSPPGLNPAEAAFLKQVRNFWIERHREPQLQPVEIYLLRNLPGIGVGFYHHSGFFPDFILWIKNRADKTTRVVFIDPHGMHHGGLSGNDDRIQAMKELKRLSEEKAFQKKRIRLNGFILTKTSLANMPGAEHMDWDRLEKEYHVLSQDDPEKYLKAVFEM